MKQKSVNIEKLLKEMTVEEKIGQLVQTNGIFFLKDDTELTGPASALEIDLDQRKNIGSLLNFKNAENAIKIQEKYAKNICIFTLCVLYCMGVKINHQKIQILGRKWFVP